MRAVVLKSFIMRICLTALDMEEAGITEAPILFGALMKAEATGKKMIIQGDLDDVVVFRNAGGRQQAGGAFGPVFQIVAGIADDDGFAGVPGVE